MKKHVFLHELAKRLAFGKRKAMTLSAIRYRLQRLNRDRKASGLPTIKTVMLKDADGRMRSAVSEEHAEALWQRWQYTHEYRKPRA